MLSAFSAVMAPSFLSLHILPLARRPLVCLATLEIPRPIAYSSRNLWRAAHGPSERTSQPAREGRKEGRSGHSNCNYFICVKTSVVGGNVWTFGGGAAEAAEERERRAHSTRPLNSEQLTKQDCSDETKE